MTVHELRIDREHSTIEFAVTFAMNSIVKGRFLDCEGQISLDTDIPPRSSASVTINANSIETGGATRDNDLKGERFFDIDANSELRFASTAVEVIEVNHWHVHGDLTMAGITRSVTLDVHFYGLAEDGFGNTRAGFVGETDIVRSDWGMNWNIEQDTGVLISDRVRISLYISAIPVEGESKDENDDVGAESE